MQTDRFRDKFSIDRYLSPSECTEGGRAHSQGAPYPEAVDEDTGDRVQHKQFIVEVVVLMRVDELEGAVAAPRPLVPVCLIFDQAFP